MVEDTTYTFHIVCMYRTRYSLQSNLTVCTSASRCVLLLFMSKDPELRFLIHVPPLRLHGFHDVNDVQLQSDSSMCSVCRPLSAAE